MSKILYVLLITFVISACSSITRSPDNVVAKDIDKNAGMNLTTDPSADQMATTDEYIDCSNYVAKTETPTEIEVVATRTTSKLAMGLMEQPLTADMALRENPCEVDCNNDKKADCLDLECVTSMGDKSYLTDALQKIGVTCESSDGAAEETTVPTENVINVPIREIYRDENTIMTK